MADTHIWTGGSDPDADQTQISYYTPGNPAENDVYTVTLSDDNGFSYAISFTALAGPSVQAIVEGLKAAAVAATAAGIQPWSQVAATEDDSDLIVTGGATGYVFYAVLTATGGTPTFAHNSSGSTAQVARSSNDFGLAANWHNNAVPTEDDSIVIPSTATANITKNLKYLLDPNLDEGGSSTQIHIVGFEVERGSTVQVGTQGQSLVIPTDTAARTPYIHGTGQKWIEFDADNQNLVFIIQEASSTSGGSMGTNISFDCGSGTATADVTLLSGQSVGFGALERESYDSLTDIEIKGGGTVDFGSNYNGTTLPDSAGVMDIGTGSTVNAYAHVLTADIEGTLNLYHDITTANIFAGRCSRLAPSSGTPGTFNVYQGGRVTFGPEAPTPTALNISGGQAVIDDEFGKTLGVAWVLNGVRPTDILMNGPKNVKWTPTAI